jgi:hypothetical protein
MRRDDWPVGQHGIGELAPPENNVCRYCRQPRGEQHKEDCVIRGRTVVVRLTVEYVRQVPEDWDEEMINFHFNEGTHCIDNEILYLRHQTHVFEHEEGGSGCYCSHSHGKYVREATEWDEQMHHTFIANAEG